MCSTLLIPGKWYRLVFLLYVFCSHFICLWLFSFYPIFIMRFFCWDIKRFIFVCIFFFRHSIFCANLCVETTLLRMGHVGRNKIAFERFRSCEQASFFFFIRLFVRCKAIYDWNPLENVQNDIWGKKCWVDCTRVWNIGDETNGIKNCDRFDQPIQSPDRQLPNAL